MMGFTGVCRACRLFHDTVGPGQYHAVHLQSLAVTWDRTRTLIEGLLERA